MKNVFKSGLAGLRARIQPWALGLIVAALLLPAQSFAHGGFDHVLGTVVKVSNDVLTVKTATGNVDVKLNKQTELTRNGKKAQTTDLKTGARVVVDLHKGSPDQAAHSVKIGALPKTSTSHAHASHS